MKDNTYSNQKLLIDAIETIVDRKLDNYNSTTSVIGVLVEDPDEFTGKVKIVDDIFTCTIPEYLHTWLQKDDVVIVQDLFNDGRKKTIIGKTGKTRVTDPSLVFYRDGHNYYGVDGVFNEDTDEKISYATVEEGDNPTFIEGPEYITRSEFELFKTEIKELIENMNKP